jgi:hypothetical protein
MNTSARWEMKTPSHFPMSILTLFALIRFWNTSYLLNTSCANAAGCLNPAAPWFTCGPSREVWREGHVGVPFSHRLCHSRLGYRYMRAMHALGIGTFWERPSRRQLVTDQWYYLRTRTFYLPEPQWHQILETTGFHFDYAELTYIRYRLRASRLHFAAPIAESLPRLSSFALKRLATMAVLCRPSTAGVQFEAAC